ncbi:hypothetical protein E2C01_049967 [Portunus trituberculatus]|uniref:Uncharacterized protein n=1 Tax=Portunus trituberculatus TaxID=210409 RepID=A0A5B7GFZ6_PORTR|nr:hypothetical protein [Portunus trituberculatus]
MAIIQRKQSRVGRSGADSGGGGGADIKDSHAIKVRHYKRTTRQEALAATPSRQRHCQNTVFHTTVTTITPSVAPHCHHFKNTIVDTSFTSSPSTPPPPPSSHHNSPNTTSLSSTATEPPHQHYVQNNTLHHLEHYQDTIFHPSSTITTNTSSHLPLKQLLLPTPLPPNLPPILPFPPHPAVPGGHVGERGAGQPSLPHSSVWCRNK